MKIFVSYTIRDGFITHDYLSNLEKKLKKHYDVFIDMLHNDSKSPQDRVIKELISSDILLLIRTKAIFTSPWVWFEINLAYVNRIPIIIMYSL